MAVTVEASGEVVVPVSVRRRAGIKAGGRLEFEATSGVITIRKKAKDEDDEYTPAQRRVIEARLAKAMEDVREGRVYGPFATQEELAASCREHGKRLRAKPTRRK